MTDCIFCHGTGKQNEHRHDNGDPLGRAINESHWYQALLFQAWRTMRGQTKGLQRQRRLITRLQSESASPRPAWKGTLAVSLENTARWLDNGCDPKQAAEELRIIASRMGGTNRPA